MEFATEQPENSVWVADTGVFIAAGRQENSKFAALARFAERHGVTFVIPRRVYNELSGAPDRSTPSELPIETAIDAGWVRIADLLDYI